MLAALIRLPFTFLVDVVLFAAAFLGIITLPKMPPLTKVARPGLKSLADGIRFLRNAPSIRTGFLIDIITMTLGRPYVLLPAAGATVIGGGPTTVGLLTAAAAVGTFLASMFSGSVSRTRRYGLAIGGAVTAHGAFIALFGVVLLIMMSSSFGTVSPGWDHVNTAALIVAGLALLGTGAADEVSASFRSSMLLTVAPDEMLGRLQGTFTVGGTSGPRLGDLYAGLLTSTVALWLPPLLGGGLIIALVGAVLRFLPGFQDYDAQNPAP